MALLCFMAECTDFVGKKTLMILRLAA